VFLVETPPEGGSESVMNHAANEELPSFTADGPSFIPASVARPDQDVAEEPAAALTGAELIAAGQKVFRKCSSCHEVGAGAGNGSGPHLNGLMGRTMGSVDGFGYSAVFAEAQAAGRVWDAESLSAFLAKPREYMDGTKMSFGGLRSDEDQLAIAAYLATFEE